MLKSIDISDEGSNQNVKTGAHEGAFATKFSDPLLWFTIKQSDCNAGFRRANNYRCAPTLWKRFISRCCLLTNGRRSSHVNTYLNPAKVFWQITACPYDNSAKVKEELTNKFNFRDQFRAPAQPFLGLNICFASLRIRMFYLKAK